MRKIFLVMGILTLSIIGVAAGSNSSEFNIKAEVIDDLEVKTTDINFGLVSRGKMIETPKEEGNLEINGEAVKKVKVKMYHNGNLINDGNLVKLSNGNSILEYNPKLYQKGTNEPLPNETSILLNDNGQAFFLIGGTLNVPENATSGLHEGLMDVKVQYDD